MKSQLMVVRASAAMGSSHFPCAGRNGWCGLMRPLALSLT